MIFSALFARAPVFAPALLRCGVLLALGLVIAGCSSSDDDVYVERPAESIYNNARQELVAGNFRIAASEFNEVERQHPYSVWAIRGQLMAAYTYYQENNYEEAVATLNRFIQLHPGNANIPYAYYLKALCYYEQIVDVSRDQSVTENALAAMEDVAKRFPDTPYGEDAKQKILLARDHLAGKEMAIGRWYQSKGEYLSAINRFQRVADKFQTTSHVPEALHRLTETYVALGLHEEARRTAAVLGYNFPSSEWYKDSYALLKKDYKRPALPLAEGEEEKEEDPSFWNWIF